MKIALLTNEFYPLTGGISKVLTSTYRAFKKSKEHQIYVFNGSYNNGTCFDILGNPKNYRYILAGLKIKTFIKLLFSIFWLFLNDKRIALKWRIYNLLYLIYSPKQFIVVYKNVTKIFRYFTKIDFDLIFAGASGGSNLLLAYILSRIFKKKVICFAHGNDFLITHFLSLKTSLFHSMDRVIVSNQNTKEMISKIHKLEENKLKILHFGLIIYDYLLKENKLDLRRKYNISMKTFIILSVGRHVKRKNFDLVIKGLKRLKEELPNYKIKYYLIGRGNYTIHLKDLVKSLNLNDSVFFLGYCKEKTRNEFYKLSDLFVMPSISQKGDVEGFGMVFLEANLFGKPVIGTYSGGMIESIIDEETGFLIQPNDMDSLIQKIDYLIKNPQERERMGQKARQRVLKEYNWNILLYTYIEFFKEIIEN